MRTLANVKSDWMFFQEERAIMTTIKPKSFKPLNRALSLCLIVIALLASLGTARGQSAPFQRELDKSRKKWASSKIKNCQYTFNWQCFCTPDYVKPVIISVRAGVIESVKYADGGTALDKADFEKYKTVESLFDMIQEAIDKKAAKIQVTYDAKAGYPISAFFDYSANIADEERGFAVKNFKVTKGK
jgi:hypothetical protein